MTKRFVFSLVFAVPLVVLSMGDMFSGQPISSILPSGWRPLLEWLFATPICTWSAWPFYQRAWDSVQGRPFNLFTLIGLGVSVAYTEGIPDSGSSQDP